MVTIVTDSGKKYSQIQKQTDRSVLGNKSSTLMGFLRLPMVTKGKQEATTEHLVTHPMTPIKLGCPERPTLLSGSY